MAGLCKNEIQRKFLIVKWFVIFLLLACSSCLSAQRDTYRIVSYNIENLFDTEDDPRTSDEEFTPGGFKHWTEGRYRKKLQQLAQTLDSAGGGGLPDVVALTEVENRRVVGDLIVKTGLSKGDYGIVHRDSPDRRGIDVALIYRKNSFRPLRSDFFELSFAEDTTLRTRDILYVAGLLGTDTLHFFVCHFPSMTEGEKKSEWKRIRAASLLREKIDSVRRLNTEAAIIVAGDMNGRADTEAQRALGTEDSDGMIRTEGLYNTGYYLLGEKYGSYRYRGVWQTLDHIIVSGVLLDGKHQLQAAHRLTVYRGAFLLEKDEKYSGSKPCPTYRGPRYVGGVSDHLPVYIDLSLQSKK